jgi:hypothetical protein
MEDNETPPNKSGGRRDKNDEEEWGGIPIPLSDDSEDEYWLDEFTSTAQSLSLNKKKQMSAVTHCVKDLRLQIKEQETG